MSATLDQRPNQPIRAGTRSVTRWEIATEDAYETFRDRFELAVPIMDYEATYRLVADEAPWARVVEIVDRDAPHGFMTYWKLDTFPVMSLAGHCARATEYLMGNHVIAEQMARHDAGALLYAPLRTTIHEDPTGYTRRSAGQGPGGVRERPPAVSAVGGGCHSVRYSDRLRTPRGRTLPVPSRRPGVARPPVGGPRRNRRVTSSSSAQG